MAYQNQLNLFQSDSDSPRVGSPLSLGESAPVLIDQGPLRKAALKACRMAMKEVESLKQRWQVFLEKDRPAFQHWFEDAFSPLLQEIQDLALKIHEKRVLMSAVAAEAERRGISHRAAYHNVISGRALRDTEKDGRDEKGPNWEQPDSAEQAVRELFEEELEHLGIDPRSMSKEDYNEQFARFRDYVGFDSPEDESGSSRHHQHHRSPFEEAQSRPKGPELSKNQATRLKQVYRILARRLHPDLNANQEERTRLLWLEVQKAYESRDLSKLEALLAMTADDPSLVMQGASIWELRRLIKSLRNSAKAVRKDLAEAKKDQAWDFFRSPAVQDQIYPVKHRELRMELRELKEALEEMDLFIALWLAADEDEEAADAAQAEELERARKAYSRYQRGGRQRSRAKTQRGSARRARKRG